MIAEAAEKLDLLLHGTIPEQIDTAALAGDELELATQLNTLFGFWREIRDIILPLSRGDLDGPQLVQTKNYLSSPFKQLHSQLKHLTWQAKQVAAGDYSQRVEFMGEFAQAFNAMVVALDEKDKALNSKIARLEEALAHIATLEAILPICSSCKKVRMEGYASDEQEGWIDIEKYISGKTETKFSHGLCPECLEKAQDGI
jgi:hypothetical protein